MDKKRVDRLLGKTFKILFFSAIVWFGLGFAIINPVIGVIWFVALIGGYIYRKKIKSYIIYLIKGKGEN